MMLRQRPSIYGRRRHDLHEVYYHEVNVGDATRIDTTTAETEFDIEPARIENSLFLDGDIVETWLFGRYGATMFQNPSFTFKCYLDFGGVDPINYFSTAGRTGGSGFSGSFAFQCRSIVRGIGTGGTLDTQLLTYTLGGFLGKGESKSVTANLAIERRVSATVKMTYSGADTHTSLEQFVVRVVRPVETFQ